MEDYYTLVSDCVHSLSSLFTFDLLLEISETSRQNSNFIYELQIHDHTEQPIYYANTSQIERFRKINTLTIPNHYFYKYLSKLTHINNIRCNHLKQLDDITKLTNLTSVRIIDEQPDEFFHTYLKKLHDYNTRQNYEFNEITSFTRLTYIRALTLNNCYDLEQFVIFSNLKCLEMDVRDDAFKLSMLKSLHKLSMLKSLLHLTIGGLFHRHFMGEYSFVIEHPGITGLKILNGRHCIIQKCFNLKNLNVNACQILDLKDANLETLILSAHTYNLPMIIKFDICKHVNLTHLECHGMNVIGIKYVPSELIKLKKLMLTDGSIKIDPLISHNLTHLFLDNYFYEFDMQKYINLKKLEIKYTQYVNINKLEELVDLKLHDQYFSNDIIDCNNFLNLTSLDLRSCVISNLFRLTKLNKLMLYNIFDNELDNIWRNDIPCLSKLIYLSLFRAGYDTHPSKILDAKYLSNCRLKYFHCNFGLDDLSELYTLQDMEIIYSRFNHDNIRKLTRLTNISIQFSTAKLKANVKNLNRLRLNLSCAQNLILPKTKIIY